MSDWKPKLRRGPFSITALERLWLKADYKTIVPDGDPEAAVLLAAPLNDIPQKLARRLGLFDEEKANSNTASPEDIKNRSTRPAEVTVTREEAPAKKVNLKGS